MLHTRKDGTYIIEVNSMPYHVIDTDEKYWSEVQQRISDGEGVEQYIPPSPYPNWIWNSELEIWEPDFEEQRVNILSKITIERDQRILSGFDYNGKQISCDNVSQANANAFLTADSQGILTYPIKWRTVDNTIIEIVDNAELKTFTGTMLLTVQTIFQESWIVKDVIESATTIEDVELVYLSYIGE